MFSLLNQVDPCDQAIAQTTGRSTAQVKADVGKLGDLGIVAESSKGSQRTMFQVPTENNT